MDLKRGPTGSASVPVGQRSKVSWMRDVGNDVDKWRLMLFPSGPRDRETASAFDLRLLFFQGKVKLNK